MQPVSKQTLRIFWQHSVRYKWSFTAILFGCLVTALADLYKPFIYGQLFNDMAGYIKNGEVNDTVYTSIKLLIAIGLLHTLIWRSVELVNNNFQPKVMADLMNTCYDYLLEHSYGFFNNSFVGSITNRVRKFAHSFESIADQFCFELGRTVLICSLLVTFMLFTFPKYGLVIIAWMLLYFSFAFLHARFKLKYDIELAEHDTSVTARLADTMTNSVNVKLFASKQYESGMFHQITDKLFRLRRFSWNLGALANLVQGVTMVSLEGLIFYMAVTDILAGKLLIGDLAILQAYVFKIVERSWHIGRQIRQIYQSLAEANEMTVMLQQPHEVVDRPDAEPLVVSQGKINFQNVSFAYEGGRTILNDFSLGISQGERIAFVGESGGGKSTIVKLLLRLVDIQKGNIAIDGQYICEVQQNSLREQIGFVPQEPILFHRSLMDNIRYGRQSATDEEVITAAKAAHCDTFIRSFEKGYNTLVGERGVKLSGGERQRVAIARAFLKNAPILVLDEATSSLDPESELLIHDSLGRLMEGRTTLVIAHRLSTIRMVDRIIVIKDGYVTEEGKHSELLEIEDGVYQKLWNIQVGGFAKTAIA